MDSSYRRSRSQSRFPPIDEHPGGYPTGQPLDNSHRSKSLDNRRDFVPEDDYDPYRSIERNSTFHASLGGHRQPRRDQYDNQNQRGGGDFFNETITIPSAHAKTNSKFDSRQRDEGADDDWTSYDRQVRYHTERTAYPSRAPQPLYYDNYGYRNQIQAPPQELSPRSAISRYPESDLYDRRYDRNYQQQQTHDYRNENEGRLRAHGHFAADGYGEEEEYLTKERQSNIGGINRGAMNESAGAAAAVAASGRSAAGGGGGGGHYRHHHESYSYGGGGAGGGASGGKAHYGQTNGYSQNAFSQFREKRSGGGFFGGGRSRKSGPGGVEPRERVYHRIHCCCFSFKWPPFAYEECEPPRPMYLSPPPKGSPMPSRHTLPPPPPPQY